MKFSVVIVNYADSWDLISRCVESLKATKYEDFEVIVPDNDSVSPDEVRSDLHIIPNGRNLGFARAVNRGIAASSGEFVVLVNPDSTIEAGFFDGMERFFSENPEVGIVGPRIVDSDGTLQLSARREVSFVSGLFGRTSVLTKLLPESRFVKDQFPATSSSDAPTNVDWVSGACMVIRRETLGRIGLLDERFFMYFEDADLCRRAREAEYGVAYVPEIEVVHEAGGSTRDSTRAIFDLHRSAFLYHRKHGRRGPANVVSGMVLAGLVVRATAKWISSRKKPAGQLD